MAYSAFFVKSTVAYHEMRARLFDPIFTKLEIEPDFPCIADEIAEPRLSDETLSLGPLSI